MALGTQAFPFDRLLRELDRLVTTDVLRGEIVAQTGLATYEPRHFRSQRFFGLDEFNELLQRCSLLVTHGGVGTILEGVRRGKKVIAVPRLKRFGEHVDDHQVEIVRAFAERKLLLGAEVHELEAAFTAVKDFEPGNYQGGNHGVLRLLDDFVAAA